MPLYEYRCEACGHQFERIQRFSDELVTVCPSCESGPVVKLVSSPAIQFKGSGWYITDYAKKNQSGSTTAKTESGSGVSESKSSSSDAPTTAAPAATSDTSKKSGSGGVGSG
jgi:putative FmdB family regulatory protein